MNKRPFWVRSASSEGAEARTPGWTIKTLKGNYPGFMGVVSAYYSALSRAQTPHDMHSHAEEEILVVLSGELAVLTAERHTRIGPGSFFYVPPGAVHTIQSVGLGSTDFLVFKWTSQSAAHTRPEATVFLFGADALGPWTQDAGIHRQRVCKDQPLANGGRLVAEAICLAPRTGYPAHSHDHDLMLILLRGQMHALGHTTSAPAIIYYPAGTVHGLAPLNPDPIDMLAFEFHRPSSTSPASA